MFGIGDGYYILCNSVCTGTTGGSESGEVYRDVEGYCRP